MPELISHSPDNPDFARVLEPRLIRELDAFPFDIAPTPAEATAVARLLGAREVRKLRFKGALTRLPKGGWRLDARLGATAVQTCVVTLDPLTTRVDQPVTRTFLPAAATSAEVVVDLDDDEIDPLGDRIDLGLVAIEALALALPAYPRRPGATLEAASAAGRGVDPLDEADLKPFAVLAALRGKSGHGS